MLRFIGVTLATMLSAVTAHAEQVSFLFCEYKTIGDEQRWRSQSIPLYYEKGELVAVGRRQFCSDEPEFEISDAYAAWSCVTAYDDSQKPASSVYVEINRYTGRYHRNDFEGHYNDRRIREIWQGVCTAHHEAQF
ncbi:hypothetical protein [Marimonas lutisalis]|uniref:hypothetical protein n=1 Tax=Marimonas lutisalis TaxID=2545756 RepID=UPI0010F55092|nr:hypothetical protein [Marimonas lutisalis]